MSVPAAPAYVPTTEKIHDLWMDRMALSGIEKIESEIGFDQWVQEIEARGRARAISAHPGRTIEQLQLKIGSLERVSVSHVRLHRKQRDTIRELNETLRIQIALNEEQAIALKRGKEKNVRQGQILMGLHQTIETLNRRNQAPTVSHIEAIYRSGFHKVYDPKINNWEAAHMAGLEAVDTRGEIK